MNTNISRKQKFFVNGIMLTAVGIAMRTAALFFNAFVSREVGAEGIGLYTIIMTVYGFAVTFATSGISLTVTSMKSSGAMKEPLHMPLFSVLWRRQFCFLEQLDLPSM